jgi:hypothetical protein
MSQMDLLHTQAPVFNLGYSSNDRKDADNMVIPISDGNKVFHKGRSVRPVI